MATKMDFSDQWFRKSFRTGMEARFYVTLNETHDDCFRMVVNYLDEMGVTLSSSAKMAYDQNGRLNNCTNMWWPLREDFVVWAQVNAPHVFKNYTKAKPNKRTTPATPKVKPKVDVGWDDFDWSR